MASSDRPPGPLALGVLVGDDGRCSGRLGAYLWATHAGTTPPVLLFASGLICEVLVTLSGRAWAQRTARRLGIRITRAPAGQAA
ncbi:hypothetical protein ABGB17_30390 [Sphaerisporangium sp. B11E5]|uniref:hypothetical protein n=1 Tax=Sphaerisporangium sp. B11E5 TaxID=3153563 RepID=UPI00325E1828